MHSSFQPQPNFKPRIRGLAAKYVYPHGDKDRVIEAKQARDLHGVLYTSDLHLVPNAGHMVTYADTAAIAQSVSSLGTANLRQSFTLGRQEKDTTRTPGAL